MIDNTNARRGTRKGDLVSSFEAIKIKLASPETIKGWSKGEVKNPETINYRSLKPEKDGLFCERIFGPTRDFECSCGKYKRIKREGDFRCDRCGVQVTESKVRRENMGHIELAVPVSHVWFFKSGHIALMLNMSAKNLEQILYYEAYVVTDPGDTPLLEGQVLSEEDYMQQRNDYGDAFIAEMGAGAIKTLLERINLQMLQGELIESLEHTHNKALKKKSMKRLRLVEGFINGNSRPEYMLLSILPVLPPDLRPLVPLDGGRYATSDLNDLYRRVINRNNRLKSLIQIRTPEVIIRNEKRMLQEAVDALMDNGRHGRAVTTMSSRALKSLSDMLKGKQGRFRQNLLGKRVDYSGRSVIVVGPELRINQCGLPKRMAMVLFEPFIIRHLKEEDSTRTVKAAKAMIEAGDPKIWDILEKVIKGHPIMLNRAPTLHRLSIQAFDPVLIEGSAIRLHPMVCTAYNADFDGDQMAVHVPLSNEAQMEAKLLMLSPNNIFSPANGKPIASPTHDITLGAYYLTCDPINKDKAKLYRDYFEAIVAKDDGYITMHDAIRIPNPDYGKDTRHGDKNSKYILTTVGRCLFNEIWDKRLGFYNKLAKKKDLQALISESYQISGHAATIKLLDDLKDLGYKHSTLAGLSISIADMKVPEEKDEIIKSTTKEIETVMGYFDAGALTDGERHKRVIDLWSQANDKVTGALLDRMEGERKLGIINPLYAMLDSGARGSKDQVRQLAGMRGLMAKPNGDIIERPIISNFREGLSVLEYFISTHGARKGLADTALKTADSGYMTRKLVDVAQDVICREEDCGTTSGIQVEALRDGDDILLPLRDRIFGRFSADAVRDPAFNDGRLIIGAGEEFTKEICDLIEKRGISRVKIRSALTCETVRGICVKCYGRNLANDRLAKIGDALGIIAAQSIGEPGTQLTMRTFHIGGTASVSAQSTEMKAQFNGVIRLMDVRTVERKKDDGTLETIVISGGGKIIIYDAEKAKALEKEKRDNARLEANATGGIYREDYDYFKDAIEESQLEEHDIEPGSELLKKDGDTVEKGDTYIKREADNIPIIADMEGIVELVGLIENVTLKKTQKANSESDQGEVTYNNTDSSTQPKIVIHGLNEKNLASDGKNTPTSEFPLQPGTVLMVKNGEKVFPGTTIAREPRESAKNRDITGGLPRISELFDARNPKVAAIISTIDGVVKKIEVHGKDNNSTNHRIVTIEDQDSKKKEVLTVPGKLRLLVRENDSVRKGQKLTEGSIVLSQLLAVRGAVELQNTLVREIQKVYRSQGVEINDKHIEIIIRQMMQKVTIIDPGDSDFMSGEVVDRSVFNHSKRSLLAQGKTPAKSEPMLLGITQASLKTDSFISAAAFQQTTDILTDAAVESKTDNLLGFKESVITGHLIPAGTGTLRMQSIKLKYLGEEIPDETIIDAETEHNVDDDIKDLFGDEIPEEANEFIVDPGELDDSFLEE